MFGLGLIKQRCLMWSRHLPECQEVWEGVASLLCCLLWRAITAYWRWGVCLLGLVSPVPHMGGRLVTLISICVERTRWCLSVCCRASHTLIFLRLYSPLRSPSFQVWMNRSVSAGVLGGRDYMSAFLWSWHRALLMGFHSMSGVLSANQECSSSSSLCVNRLPSTSLASLALQCCPKDTTTQAWSFPR